MEKQAIPKVKFICRFIRENKIALEYSRLCVETANRRFYDITNRYNGMSPIQIMANLNAMPNYNEAPRSIGALFTEPILRQILCHSYTYIKYSKLRLKLKFYWNKKRD